MVYLDAAVRRLKAQGYPVCDEDMARLSPFVNIHLGVHGTYSFLLPDLAPAPSANYAIRTPPTRTTSDRRTGPQLPAGTAVVFSSCSRSMRRTVAGEGC